MVNQNYSVLVNTVVFKNNRVLIIQRSKKEKHQAGKWSIPGGKLETKGIVFDALQKSARREVREETGVRIGKKIELIMNNTFTHFEDKTPVVAIVFMAQYQGGVPKALDDTQKVRWITQKEINNFEFSPNVKKYIKQGYAKRSGTSRIL